MKVYFLIITCIFFSFALSAQTGFFGRMKKPDPPKQTTQRNAIGRTTVTATDSNFFAIRPSLVPAAFSVISGRVSAGAGFGLKRINYNYATQKFYTQWSINAIGLLGGVIAPTTPQMAGSYALTLGLLNDVINIGLELNSRKEKPEDKFVLKPDLILSYTVNFNN